MGNWPHPGGHVFDGSNLFLLLSILMCGFRGDFIVFLGQNKPSHQAAMFLTSQIHSYYF